MPVGNQVIGAVPPRPAFLAQQRFRRECVQGWQTYSPGDEPSDSRSGCVALGQPLDLSEPWSSCCKWGLCHLICVDFVKFLPERGFGGRAPLLQVLRKGGQAGELSWAGLAGEERAEGSVQAGARQTGSRSWTPQGLWATVRPW